MNETLEVLQFLNKIIEVIFICVIFYKHWRFGIKPDNFDIFLLIVLCL